MKIDLASLFNNEGFKMPFDFEVSANEDNLSIKLKALGKVENVSGTIELTADVTAFVSSVCSRCLEPASAVLEFDIKEQIDDDNEDLSGTVLDVGNIAVLNAFANIPIKFLCSDNCKGLCAQCGANLNRDQCKCSDDEIDERFAALKKLLD